MTNLFDLSGKVAIVTGAGAGLGVTFADALAEAGAHVLCADLNGDRARQTAADLSAKGFSAIGTTVDVTVESQVQEMVKLATETWGSIDILINNAGIASVGPAEDETLETWQRVIDVNLTGTFLCAREVAKVMIAAGSGGSIVNLASILGLNGSEPMQAVSYAASKGAVVNLTRDLAIHWAPQGIRVNALGPAYFPSEMTGGLLADTSVLAEVERRTPMGRVGRPEELRGPVLFLASNASSYVTGQTLFVDGGWTAW
ncbi:MAG TPA: SDR family oxidoreductase [Thermomicrobiales bacterium]|nr:SDR family oxidoreductase [Thermomicrobiales bacterium]